MEKLKKFFSEGPGAKLSSDMMGSLAPNQATSADDDFSLYKELFVSGCYGIKGGFLIQLPGKTWFDPKRKIRDSDIIDHLEQQKSVAAIPAFYDDKKEAIKMLPKGFTDDENG